MQLKRHFRAGRRPREAVMTFLEGNPIGWGLGGFYSNKHAGWGMGEENRLNHGKAFVPIQGQAGKPQTAVQAWSLQSRLSGASSGPKSPLVTSPSPSIAEEINKSCVWSRVCIYLQTGAYACLRICTCVCVARGD